MEESIGTVNRLHSWYRGFIQGKTRILFAWIFGFALIFSARQYPTLPGIILCFVGATIRFWGSGYLRKDNQLSISGPYRFTRNPLYLGTYLMALGVALAVEAWILLAVLSVSFWAVYHYIILDEETKLRKMFGEPYDRFCALVPRFFPRLWPPAQSKISEIDTTNEQSHFSWKEAVGKNKAHEAYLAFLALIGLTIGTAWVWQNFLPS